MKSTKITARGQISIPKTIREAADLREGDMIAFEIEGNRLVMRKVVPGRDEYLHGLGEVMGELALARGRGRLARPLSDSMSWSSLPLSPTDRPPNAGRL